MPIHDWARVDAGLFHNFHQNWITSISHALNTGRLPPGYFELAEQSVRGPIPDVIALRLSAGGAEPPESGGGLAVAEVPPRARVVRRTEMDVYVQKADRIAVRHGHGQLVAVIEVVSPGNQASKGELRTFVEKAAQLIRQGVHLLVVDLFPPTKRDPQGIHKAIWDEFEEEDFEPPVGQPLVLAAYDAGPPPVAYVESIAVGEALPNMPLFPRLEIYVPAPLETTYQASWNFFPAALKGLLETPAGEPIPPSTQARSGQ
ncbi:MAG: DUF4058 family protein [Isosphaeraceae bacterium]